MYAMLFAVYTALILFKAMDTRTLWLIDVYIKYTGFERLFDDISSEFIPSVLNPLNN